MRNKHHVLFPKAIHESTKYGNELRNLPHMVPVMDVDIHQDLHKNIAMVPPLNYYIGNRVLYLMRGSDANNSVDAIHDYMSAVDEAIRHPKAGDLEKRLGGLVIDTMQEQIPFIENSNRLLREIDLRRPQRGKRA